MIVGPAAVSSAEVWPVLIVLAKARVPVRVKRRLCPTACLTQAADLAAAALPDALTAAVPGTRAADRRSRFAAVAALRAVPAAPGVHR